MASLSDDGAKFLGKSKEDKAQILRWTSLANSELLPSITNAFKPLTGAAPYNKKQVDTALESIEKITSIFEKRLADFTFLVGERITLADIISVVAFFRGFEYLFGADWRKKFPNTTRWFKTVIESPVFKGVLPELKFREKIVEFTPPKKEKKQQPKAEKKEAAASKPAEAPAAAEPKKLKHPLEALGKSKTSLEEWKRIYSNEETREVAIPWFWKNMYDPSEWSLWKVDYRYNDELTLTFMSNNLVGGFFNRLSASTKYMFGCVVVYGENNDNGITGFFLIRGQDYKPAVDVAPDWESYSYSKLDANNEEDKKFIDNMLAWDQPVVVDGRSREIADGKVFK